MSTTASPAAGADRRAADEAWRSRLRKALLNRQVPQVRLTVRCKHHRKLLTVFIFDGREILAYAGHDIPARGHAHFLKLVDLGQANADAVASPANKCCMPRIPVAWIRQRLAEGARKSIYFGGV